MCHDVASVFLPAPELVNSTFLPQDRVAEFARMTPQQLLRETQRCAGNENLTSWHDTLIQSGKDLKTLQAVIVRFYPPYMCLLTLRLL